MASGEFYLNMLQLLSFINKMVLLALALTLLVAAVRPAPRSIEIHEHQPVVTSPAQTVPPCHISLNYAPYVPEHVPIKTVRLVFHIMQDDNGNGNFIDTEEHKKWLKGPYLGTVNKTMGNLKPMNLETESVYLTDSRIRYVLDTLFFHRDSLGYDMRHDSGKMGMTLHKRWALNNPDVIHKEDAIHIFIGALGSSHGRASGISSGKWVLVSGVFARFQKGNHWVPAGLLAHELGHSLGLGHTWNWNDGCDDTPKNPGCWNVNEPKKPECAVPSNNMMDYNACQCALTACQLGKMHFALMGRRGTASTALVDDYCKSDGTILVIPSGDSVYWSAARYLKSDVTVEPGAVLHIGCEIGFPKNAKLVVKPGGKLWLDGGKLYQPCGNTWKGVVLKVKKKKKKVVAEGSLMVTNGGTIVDLKEGATSE